MEPRTGPARLSLMQPYVPSGAIEAVAQTLGSRWIGQGPKVDEFERRFSRECAGDRACVAVGSGTDALHLAYLLAGIEAGDEVIAPVFTCTATNIPLLWMGAEIRFADVAPDSLNIDAQHVRSLITERTKAIVVVHYGGAPVDLEPIWALGLPVIEDCAQALGANYEGWPVGCSEFACYSFQAVKHVTTGDGGMLVLPDAVKEKARRMRWFGIDRKAKQNGTWANDISEVGYKYQMTDIGAVLGLAGLNTLADQLAHRRALMEAYQLGLATLAGISLFGVAPGSAHWLCTVLVEDRKGLKAKLAEHGIESDQAHYRNDRYTIFEKFRGEFPHMDSIDAKYLCLPLHMGMSLRDVDFVCRVIRSGW